MKNSARASTVAARRDSRWLPFVLGICLMGALSTGCAAAAAAPTTIPKTLLAAVVAAVAKKRGLQFSPGTRVDADGKKLKDKSADDQEADRHRGFFIWRRADFYKETEANSDSVSKVIDDEFGAMKSLENELVNDPQNPGPLRKAAPDGSSTAALTSAFTCDLDKHLDLINIASDRKGAPFDGQRKNLYQRRRVQAGIAILWRAAAIHPELWDTNTNPPTLNKEALRELIDHRLRIVERMDNQVNAPKYRILGT